MFDFDWNSFNFFIVIHYENVSSGEAQTDISKTQ